MFTENTEKRKTGEGKKILGYEFNGKITDPLEIFLKMLKGLENKGMWIACIHLYCSLHSPAGYQIQYTLLSIYLMPQFRPDIRNPARVT